MSPPGKLYLVPTPIGNLQDTTLRAVKTLFAVDAIACEDSRKTGLFLEKISEIFAPLLASPRRRPKLLSYFEGNARRRLPQLIRLLKEGRRLALVSNAGTPLVSDPGYRLVRECWLEGIPLEALPGPTVVTTALSVSGLPPDKFFFVGFLPKKTGQKTNLLERLKKINGINKTTFVAFSTPHRLIQDLKDIQLVLGDIQAAVCRELTKMHEEIYRGKISEVLKKLADSLPKGEVTLVLNANQK